MIFQNKNSNSLQFIFKKHHQEGTGHETNTVHKKIAIHVGSLSQLAIKLIIVTMANIEV